MRYPGLTLGLVLIGFQTTRPRWKGPGSSATSGHCVVVVVVFFLGGGGGGQDT